MLPKQFIVPSPGLPVNARTRGSVFPIPALRAFCEPSCSPFARRGRDARHISAQPRLPYGNHPFVEQFSHSTGYCRLVRTAASEHLVQRCVTDKQMVAYQRCNGSDCQHDNESGKSGDVG